MKDLLISGEASRCCILVMFITFVLVLRAESCCRHVMLVIRGLCSFTSISLLYCSVRLMPLSDSVVLQFCLPSWLLLQLPCCFTRCPAGACASFFKIDSSLDSVPSRLSSYFAAMCWLVVVTCWALSCMLIDHANVWLASHFVLDNYRLIGCVSPCV